MRMLVVEDEANLAQALRDGLMGEGFAVDLARNGVDGLHLAQVHDYDDIMLPRLSGYDVCRCATPRGRLDPCADPDRQGR